MKRSSIRPSQQLRSLTLYLYRGQSVRPIGEHDAAETDTVRDACVTQLVAHPEADAVRAIDDFTGKTFASVIRSASGIVDDDLAPRPDVKRYDVTIKRTLVSYATVTVLARNREQARENAFSKLDAPDADRLFAAPEPVGALEVDEIVDI